ncbi:hypothetical protein PZ895_11430 [Mesorhizobium sp. YIM 152430]|uniref:hypothetical protein n=1 Tax=Mesorhizobium sp. YIM 152430 TaxID=3031761 RepID=UPI0023DC5E3A|nr:hypothetical protein [Mesorhizobium sp. YIM 152430]MDF1600371.1 hypothetical protein [Mesorhizobium sp. YIM 152430]
MTIDRFFLDTVPRLDGEDIRELAGPLGLEITHRLRQELEQRIEWAARNLVAFFQEPDPEQEKRADRDRLEEFRLIAADPARSLERSAFSEGAKSARRLLAHIATAKNIDADTRRGAAAVGDHAANLLANFERGRVDTTFRLGIATLFEDIVCTLGAVAPEALAGWPSNMDDASCPATDFAMTFVQIVHERTLTRLPAPSPRGQKWLASLLNKSHRSLLDGLREARRMEADFDRFIAASSRIGGEL